MSTLTTIPNTVTPGTYEPTVVDIHQKKAGQ
jgi:hypothetical protein